MGIKYDGNNRDRVFKYYMKLFVLLLNLIPLINLNYKLKH